MKRILYVGFYSHANDPHSRAASVAAVTLMDYVAGALAKSAQVRIAAPSWSTTHRGYLPAMQVRNGEATTLYPPSFGTGSMLRRIASKVGGQLWLLRMLAKARKETDGVLVYHAPVLGPTLFVARVLFGTRYTLQVNEIYSRVVQRRWFYRVAEKWLLDHAEAFIFATATLPDHVQLAGRPFLVCGGTYRTESRLASPPKDGRIHLVYAGLIDREKLGGGLITARLAAWLPSNYRIRIIGWGTEKDLQELRNTIAEVTALGRAEVTYDGVRTGEAYIRTLQTAHIGLATQHGSTGFNDSSFPSKIYSYLASGLHVVSIDNRSTRSSPVAGVLHFYTDGDYEGLARAVQAIDAGAPAPGGEHLKRLDQMFSAGVPGLVCPSLCTQPGLSRGNAP